MATLAELAILLTAQDKASGVLNNVQKNATSMGDTVKAAAKVVAVGAAAAAAGFAALAVSAVKSASDQSEALNKVRVVFGETSQQIEDFSRDAAKNLGLSRTEALSAAGTFGNLFVAMKIGQPEAANMSKGILKLASDLGSFNNIPVTEALDKLRAGLVGETEPLRALGVNLTAATVEARAMEMGFQKVGGELTAAAKAQAAYSLILEQTTTAQGDFDRTSSGMANSLRTIQGHFEDIQAAIGSKLLPVIEPLIASFAARLPAALDATIRFIDNVKLAIDTFASAYSGKSIIGDITFIEEGEAEEVRTKLAPIQQTFKDIGEAARLMIDGITTARQAWAGEWTAGEGIENVHLVIGNAVNAFRALDIAFTTVDHAAANFFNNFRTKAFEVFTPVAEKQREFGEFMQRDMEATRDKYIGAWNAISETTTTVAGWVGEKYGDIGRGLGLLGIAGDVFRVGWANNWLGIQTTVTTARDALGKIFDGIKEAVGTVGEVIGGVFAGIRNAISGAIDWVMSRLSLAIKAINDFITAWNSLPIGPDIGRLANPFEGGFSGSQGEGFAKGGIVPGPIGAPRLILAHGGEPVLPVGAGAGIGAPIIVNVYGSVTTEDNLVDAIHRALLLRQDRNASLGFR